MSSKSVGEPHTLSKSALIPAVPVSLASMSMSWTMGMLAANISAGSSLLGRPCARRKAVRADASGVWVEEVQYSPFTADCSTQGFAANFHSETSPKTTAATTSLSYAWRACNTARNSTVRFLEMFATHIYAATSRLIRLGRPRAAVDKM